MGVMGLSWLLQPTLLSPAQVSPEEAQHAQAVLDNHHHHVLQGRQSTTITMEAMPITSPPPRIHTITPQPAMVWHSQAGRKPCGYGQCVDVDVQQSSDMEVEGRVLFISF